MENQRCWNGNIEGASENYIVIKILIFQAHLAFPDDFCAPSPDMLDSLHTEDFLSKSVTLCNGTGAQDKCSVSFTRQSCSSLAQNPYNKYVFR